MEVYIRWTTMWRKVRLHEIWCVSFDIPGCLSAEPTLRSRASTRRFGLQSTSSSSRPLRDTLSAVLFRQRECLPSVQTPMVVFRGLINELSQSSRQRGELMQWNLIVKSLNRVQYSIDMAGYLESIIVEVSVILVMLSLTLFSSVPQP